MFNKHQAHNRVRWTIILKFSIQKVYDFTHLTDMSVYTQLVT